MFEITNPSIFQATIGFCQLLYVYMPLLNALQICHVLDIWLMMCDLLQIRRIYLIWKCFTLDLCFIAVISRQSYYHVFFFLKNLP